MEKTQLINMNPHVLLSVINMKLRDEFDDLNALCEDYNISSEMIEERLKSIGYRYEKTHNQFISIEV